MNKLYLLLFGIVGWTTVHSQNFEWLNYVSVSNPSSLDAQAMDLDNDGNLVVAGSFKGLVDFDHGPGVTNLSSWNTIYSDLYVMKIDQNGNFVWSTDFNGSNIKEYTDIAVDDQNFIYTVGSFKQTVDFLPSGSNVQSHDVFVQKLDENGTQLWAAQFKGVDLNFSGDVSVDSQGNVYVNGAFSDSVDFDPGVSEYFLHANNPGRCFLVKLDSNGVFQWAQNFGDNNVFQPGAMQVDSNDDIVVCGTIYTAQDFDPGPDTLMLGNEGKHSCFVVKFDDAGNLIWGKEINASYTAGTIISDYIKCIALTIDPFDNIALTGQFSGTVDLDPGAGQHLIYGNSLKDLFVVNLNSAGDFNWGKRIGSPNIATGPSMLVNTSVYGNNITSDLVGNVYVTGTIIDTTIFDEGGTDVILDPGQGDDLFILKYDNLGAYKWTVRLEGNEQVSSSAGAYGHDIRIGQNDQIYTTGYFGQEVDFDPGIGDYSVGQLGCGGFFLLALNQVGLSVDGLKLTDNFVYPNPTSDYVYLNEIVESIIVYNASGQIVSQKSNGQVIDLSAQPPGVYSLLLDSRPYRVVKR